MKRILVLSGDILPFPGFPTTGAGLRAWGIGKGLESRGHDVLLAMPQSSVQKMKTVPEELRPLLYQQDNIPAFIERHQPEVVVFQHWWLTTYLKEPLPVPLVIDFHGPLLLEILFQDNPAFQQLRHRKITALHKADFFTCAGENQRHYFFPWLMMAGFDLREHVIETIPVSLSPELPEHRSAGELSFVYGGLFLPWQDPELSLRTLVNHLETHQQGCLKFFGGKHPVVAVPTNKFDRLRADLEQHDRVRMQPMIPREQLIREYSQAHVAFDIMQRNAERELAFTTRTVEYLWCGLPVMYNNFAELADYIRSYEAGWAVDPQDTDALRDVLDDILANPDRLATRSRNAQQLVRERLTWDKTIEPLDAFCRNPVRRKKANQPLANSSQHDHQLLYMMKKLRFHIEHEGGKETLKRIWRKLMPFGSESRL